jgi:hypothetical protein
MTAVPVNGRSWDRKYTVSSGSIRDIEQRDSQDVADDHGSIAAIEYGFPCGFPALVAARAFDSGYAVVTPCALLDLRGNPQARGFLPPQQITLGHVPCAMGERRF